MRINPIDPSIRHKKRKKIDDAVYCAWLREQSSAFSGKSVAIEACHFRTAENSGIGIKPLFCAIPLTHNEHMEQHRIGTFKFASRDWWIKRVIEHQQKFIRMGGEIPSKYLIKGE